MLGNRWVAFNPRFLGVYELACFYIFLARIFLEILLPQSIIVCIRNELGKEYVG